MGFNAGKAVEPLAWDFTAYGGGSGVTPEPSTKQIEQYHRKLQATVTALKRLQSAAVFGGDELTPEQLKEQMRQWRGFSYQQALELVNQELDEAVARAGDSADQVLLVTEMTKLLAEAASNCPTMEQIQTLPHRVRFAYFGWFTQELLDPEVVAAGMSPSLALVKNG